MVGAACIQKTKTRNGKEQRMFCSPEDTVNYVRHLRFSGSVKRSALEKLKPSTGNSQGQNRILGKELLEARPNIVGCGGLCLSFHKQLHRGYRNSVGRFCRWEE
jgi:hypothetical protein